MIAVIQRCSRGKVSVSNKVVGQISHGLVIFLGVQKNDTENDAEF
ncbi:MAG: D-tyrosyl-tRNA(Tyr) deacylase, partial [Candidatus Marinimicrobia bacterium]|nr:D-tyrosyl-tRNA(Tyr) deacylase [Candidatus Neomarinimicrobiota bacterium]